MAKEIIVNTRKNQTRIAILDNGELAELHFENAKNTRTLGDIYLGRIRQIMPSIRAAFVDIGREQDAFLHFSDLEENLDAMLAYVDEQTPKVEVFYPEWVRRSGGLQNGENAKRGSSRRKRGSPGWLKRDARILVRIVKEPIGNKGSRVSTGISLAGRFLVLVPLADYVAVSKKVDSWKERNSLRKTGKAIVPDGFGLIVRTVAEGKKQEALETDIRLLLERWSRIEAKLAGRPPGPLMLHEDVSMASSIIRDLFSDEYDRILVDGRRMHRSIRNYVQAVAPHMVPRVKFHSGKESIFAKTGLENEIDEVFDSRVSLPSGGYLIIEHTEAMHVIDVNSGSSGKGMKKEESSLKVNLEAAHAIARQIRLRDLGGIIVVDCIDQRVERNRTKIFDEFRESFRDDRAVTKILPMSDFGLIQITRQRLRPSITDSYEAPRSDKHRRRSRKKTGGDPATLEVAIAEWLNAYGKLTKSRKPIRLRVHPFTAVYLKRGLFSILRRWRFVFRIRIRLEADPAIGATEFRCFDAASGADVTKLRKRLPKRSRPSKGKSRPVASKGKPSVSAQQKQRRRGKSASSRSNRSSRNRGQTPAGQKRGTPPSAAHKSNSRRREPSNADKRRNGPKRETLQYRDKPVSIEES